MPVMARASEAPSPIVGRASENYGECRVSIPKTAGGEPTGTLKFGTNSGLTLAVQRCTPHGRLSWGKHLHLDAAQAAHDPTRPEAEVAGLKMVDCQLAWFLSFVSDRQSP